MHKMTNVQSWPRCLVCQERAQERGAGGACRVCAEEAKQVRAERDAR